MGSNEINPKFKPGNFSELMSKNSEIKMLDSDFQESENRGSNPRNPKVLLPRRKCTFG
jgi:hypothetical protein